MALEKISQYAFTYNDTIDTDEILFDISHNTDGLGDWRSEKLPGNLFVAQLNSQIKTLYSQDGAIADAIRNVDLGTNVLGFTNGFVSIGGIAPGVYKLRIVSGAAEHALKVDVNSSSNVMVISDDGAFGKVSFGGLTATEGVEFFTNARFNEKILQNLSDAQSLSDTHFAKNSANALISQVSSVSANPVIAAVRTRGTIAAPTGLLNNDIVGQYVFTGHNGSTFTDVCQITAKAKEIFSSGNHGSELQFLTTTLSAGAPSQKMVLNANGNLGINVTDATERLHVDGNGLFTNIQMGAPSGNSGFISHPNNFNATDYGFLQSNIGITVVNAKVGQFIDFRLGDVSKMRMDTNGSFGINTTSPGEKLHVIGNIRTTNAIIGSPAGTAAYFSHPSFFSTTDYAILQSNTGITRINSKTAIEIQFAHNGTINTRIVAGDWGFGITSPSDKIDVSGNVRASGHYKVGSIQVVGAQGAAVIDATDAATAITQLNALLARVRAHGLIA